MIRIETENSMVKIAVEGPVTEVLPEAVSICNSLFMSLENGMINAGMDEKTAKHILRSVIEKLKSNFTLRKGLC